MSSSRRTLRSSSSGRISSTILTTKPPAERLPSPLTFTNAPVSSAKSQDAITVISQNTKLPFLKPAELLLLRKKQRQLSCNASSTLTSLPDPKHLNALLSTLIFAQYEAGTAVCIHPSGWLLTCAHCFGDNEQEYEPSEKRKWLLYYTGLAVLVECRAWDARRDLALLRIIAIEAPSPSELDLVPVFSFLEVAEGGIKLGSKVICIGQPGKDDFEAEGEKKTRYNLIEVSEGRFRGMVQRKDPQDNGQIGTLMHDAWTYWGHSGAPLVSAGYGKLLGLHSSWDNTTAMRHGVPGVAVREFLKEQMNGRLENIEEAEVSGNLRVISSAATP